MATLSNTAMTLADWAKRTDPNGKAEKIAELLGQKNEILTDMLFKEGNLPTGDQQPIRTGLPTAYYRMTNQGVPSSKSTTAQITESTASLEARSHVDQDIAELNGNVASTRLSEADAFLEAMNQAQATTLVYGTSANPEEYVGFMSRYNDLSAPNAANILDAGGTGSDNTSILLVGWGDNTIYGIFPKGSKAGLSHEDLGLDDVADSEGNLFRAYKDIWKWKNGLMVKDWRYGVRIANIDVSDLVGLTGTQATTASTSIIKMMSRAIDRMPMLTGIKPVFYVNRTVASHLRLIGLDKSSSAVTVEPALNQFGGSIFTTRFLGIPVRLVDTITNAEARVV
jgi:hypothetical protein